MRLSQVATPAADVVTTTWMSRWDSCWPGWPSAPASPAALHTAGHALVLADDGELAGVLTPADFARAAQLGACGRAGRARARPG